jgi:ABC-2 type transport system permease protein
MIRTLHSEWTKLRTQRGALIALASMFLLMVGMSAFAASESETNAVFGGDDDVVQLGLAGVVFAELAVVVVGASLITSEYTTGMIRTTLTATQSRLGVLAAKVAVLVLVTFPAALAASALAFVIAQPLLRDGGYVAPAYPPVTITDPAAARAVVGTALLLTAYALIALGIGTIVRHSGGTIAAGIAVIFVPLLMLGVFPQNVRVRLEQFSPFAGMAIQSTTDRMLSAFDGEDRGMPIGHWTGLGVAFAWALMILSVGYVVLRARDA